MTFERDITSLENLPLVAGEFLKTFPYQRVFLFDAPMGTGKTTFIKQLCVQLGCKGNLNSPTYSIVNEYHSPAHKVFHFDLYRLKNMEELFDIGFEEYINGNAYCFIEWPQMALPLLEGEPYVIVNLTLSQNKRLLVAKSI